MEELLNVAEIEEPINDPLYDMGAYDEEDEVDENDDEEWLDYEEEDEYYDGDKPLNEMNEHERNEYYDINNNYHTSYKITDPKKGILLQEYNTACFSTFTNEFFNHKEKGWVKDTDRIMEVFIPEKYVRLSDNLVRWYIKQLKRLDLKFKFRILKNYTLPKYVKRTYDEKGKPLDWEIREYFPTQRVFRIKFRLGDFSSIEQVKLLTHMFRYIYEYQNYKIIEHTHQYMKKWKGLNFISAFSIISCRYNFDYKVGHSVFSGDDYYNGVSTKKCVKDLYAYWANKSYNNNGMNDIRSSLYCIRYRLDGERFNNRWMSNFIDLHKRYSKEEFEELNPFQHLKELKKLRNKEIKQLKKAGKIIYNGK